MGHHDKDFKMYAARLVVEEGKKPKQLAEEFDVSIQTLRNWVNTYKEERDEKLSDVGKGTSCLDDEKDKIIQELREENEILKKAMYVFTKNG
ncbi:transposase [Oceanobacillus alkalisoli]|uniref:transposase n=1 Tax=Oceanobacillus alkalisoli TaxID=2925113 RepID=UPI001EEF9CA6|nr:transposase [Oceanobacillus alkalisoli]MCF3942295.1 transposase [Oceanobacillus alkalisoli]MCG5102866.1 transposase [Oceanobacillus alkalisoli]